MNFENRFWSKVDKTEHCWNWTAGKTKEGYGRFQVKGKTQKAHRISYELYHKKTIPDGLIILHACDNPSCVRPEHLSTGTVKDNVDDMFAKNRANKAKGSNHGSSKITERDVLIIRKMADEGAVQKTIGQTFGIGQQQVSNILTGKKWKHLNAPNDP